MLSKLFKHFRQRTEIQDGPYTTYVCPCGIMWLVPHDPEKYLLEVLAFEGTDKFIALVHQRLRDLQNLPCGCEMPNTTEIE